MPTAPTDTYSTATPALRRLTSSKKAGGNDHSRPTSSPMRLIRLLYGSVVPADVPPDHLLPVRPVVVPAVPDPERVADPLVPQNRRELAVRGAQRVVAADRENDVLPAERVEPPSFVLVRDE